MFQKGQNVASQPNEDDEAIIPINYPKGAPPNIPFNDLIDAPIAFDIASVADSHNSDEHDPENLHQSKEIW